MLKQLFVMAMVAIVTILCIVAGVAVIMAIWPFLIGIVVLCVVIIALNQGNEPKQDIDP